VVTAVRSAIDRGLDQPGVNLTAIGSVLRRVHTAAEDEDAVLTVQLREDQVEDLIDLVKDLLEARATEEEPAPQRPRPTVPEPDEVLRPGN